MEYDSDYVDKLLKKFSDLPRFEDGRINYAKAEKAPVLNCFVKFRDWILLLKRSSKVRVYKGKWNSVGGFIDETRAVKDQVLKELNEELGITVKDITDIRLGKPVEFFDPVVRRTWLVHPSLVELKRQPDIKLDWEHTEYRWIRPEEIKNFDVVYKLDELLQRMLS
jgi:8-oxo-dGTP pyrophosphatase MutT (NUDIX family)